MLEDTKAELDGRLNSLGTSISLIAGRGWANRLDPDDPSDPADPTEPAEDEAQLHTALCLRDQLLGLETDLADGE
ncbi:hypothetical protein FSARC_2849 [Fusarium sarcochroum]|uniref:Uncharacterized protein n=1 Tax=Fusarium sarcochroum TaxID=1208366 RepID=A0A8H4U5L4_9HYPO|nr:hypothetical protein FSARC_2849 [Fusarium sarcochroum]